MSSDFAPPSAASQDQARDKRKAPRRTDGAFFYVVEVHSWGRMHSRLVAATSLAEAKAEHGWSRNVYETLKVHRATVAEVAGFPDWQIPPLREEPSDG